MLALNYLVYLRFGYLHSGLDNIDALDRARLVAFAAADALVVIDLRAEVFDRDRVVFAGLDALHAADAARLAVFSGLRALVMVLAHDGGLCLMQGHKVNYALGAGVDAHLAGMARERIYSRNTLADMNGVIGADLNAVAEADAAVDAVFRTAEKLSRHFAALDADIVELRVRVMLVALAEDDGGHGDDIARRKAGYLRNGLADLRAAGHTATGIGGLALGERGRIAGAAGEAARAAVCAGQRRLNLLGLFVDRNGHDL